jgi:hypothetical protein
MRQSLMRTFQQIYILDLHGNAKKKEHAPDGSKDENVFDIEQGVAISVFVKRPGLERRVWRGDLWGKRLAKYKIAAEESIATIVWQPIDPASPYYAFRHEDVERRAVYEKGWPLPAIFALNSVGMVTGRDRLAVHFSKSEAYGTVKRFSTLETEEARREYNLGPDAQDWKVAWAQEDIRATRTDDSRLIQIAYQPFDFRWTYYTGKPSGFHVRPRRPVSDAMLKQNLAIISNRSQEIPGDWSNVLVVRQPATHHTVSNKEVNTVFPLYTDGLGSNENFSSEFRAFLDGRYEHHYTPEEILGYIYAVLHTSTYRTCYAGFLRIDFPRVPFPELGDDFETLSGLGWGLVQAHLLRELPRHGLAGYFGKGDHTVEAVRYLPEEQAVAINKTQCFKPVPQAVWDFHIGGYQVLEKYLKSRKGRTLSLDEIRCLLSPIASPSPSSRWQGSMRHTGPPFRTGDNSTQSSHQPVYWCIMRLIRLSERSELMARTGQPGLFVTESQSDLFGAEAVPSYRPDSGKVRARLHKILAEARAAQTSPWEPTRVSLYRTIFPQMTLWLPEDEAAQLRFEFETELARLEAA